MQNNKDEENIVEKKQGTEILPGAEYDEISDADVEKVAGGSQAMFTTPGCITDSNHLCHPNV
jgi:hypothetical protein